MRFSPLRIDIFDPINIRNNRRERLCVGMHYTIVANRVKMLTTIGMKPDISEDKTIAFSNKTFLFTVCFLLLFLSGLTFLPVSGKFASIQGFLFYSNKNR